MLQYIGCNLSSCATTPKRLIVARAAPPRNPADFESNMRPFDAPRSDHAGRYDIGFDELGDRLFADDLELPK